MARGAMAGPGPARPPERTKDLRGTLRRLLGRLRPELARLVAVLVFAVTSVGFLVARTRILGNATNVLFNGVVGQQLPAGHDASAGDRPAAGPRQGPARQHAVRDERHPRRRRRLQPARPALGLAALVYLLGAALNLGQGYIMAGVAQRAMYGMRRDVEAKLARLPLRYFDSHPHGDILSRVTNDIDNLTTTLQQGLSQLLTSVLTIVGVLGDDVLDLPAAGHGLRWSTVPLSLAVTFLIARRSQIAVHRPVGGDRRAERARRRDAHRATRWCRSSASARPVMSSSAAGTGVLYEASFRAQFLSGIIQPAMQAAVQPELRGDRGHRRLLGGLGPDLARRRQSRSSSTRASSRCRSRRSPAR